MIASEQFQRSDEGGNEQTQQIVDPANVAKFVRIRDMLAISGYQKIAFVK